jgi:ectoine hydroxylase-related dioxygenase (phytanoyl-CoA dioxygenase family)
MTVEQIVAEIRSRGYSVVEGVIPADRAGSIRDDILELHEVEAEANRRREEEIKSKGHRVGARGVSGTVMVINSYQGFAPYLAEPRVLGTAEACFGPFVRIASAGSIVTQPGNARGYWHADWPYNQTNASRVAVPYPNVMMVLSSLWMLTPFNAETGGTLLVPGSHRTSDNPSGNNGFDADAAHPDEVHATGSAGSVLLYDARLWHSVAPNRSAHPRVALSVRYAPWWLNLNPEMAGTPEHALMVVERSGKSGNLPPIRPEVYAALPAAVQPLFRHSLRARG